MTLQPGQTVGRYQIIEPLGVGGMATVYKAFQPSLEREVALKVLRAAFAEDPEFFQRFQREARSIARLRHPHIVQIFDFEPVDGRYILAMEFLEGGTLKERVTALAAQGERLPRGEITRIVGEVAAALSYGHQRGIVHRDVKPSNVMLAEGGRAVVTDFGIAKIMGDVGQTQTGVGIGTPEYMAPEQGTGAKVDHRADIYSLGVMAYEMLTGRVPFTADTPLAIVIAHIRDPLPLPSSVDPSVGPATEKVLLRALAKDAQQRHDSATDFADALHDAVVLDAKTATVATMFVRSPATSASPEASPRTRGALPRSAVFGVLGALVLAAAGGGAYSAGAFRATPTPVAAPDAAPVTAPVTAATEAPRPPASQSPTPAPDTGAVEPLRANAFNATVVPRGRLLLDAGPMLELSTPRGEEGVRFSYAGSALDVTIDVPGRVASMGIPVEVRNDYVVDLELRVPRLTPRAEVGLQIRQDAERRNLQLSVSSSGSAQVYFGGPGLQGVPLGARFAVTPGDTVRLTLVVQDRRIQIVREGSLIVDFMDDRVEPVPMRPYLYLQTREESGTATMRLITLRYYAGPTR